MCRTWKADGLRRRHFATKEQGSSTGEKRKANVTMQSNVRVTFKAGRDGQVIATKQWDGEPGNPGRVPVVVVDDTNPHDKLAVTTGLR